MGDDDDKRAEAEARVGYEAGRAHAGVAREPVTVDSRYHYVAVPAGTSLLDVERFLSAPRRTRLETAVYDIGSLIHYALRFTDGGAGAGVYVDPLNNRVTLVVDHDFENSPSWREHAVRYLPQESDEWRAWSNLDRRPISQEQLAEHLEERATDIVEPQAAVVMEVATSLEATKEVAFRRGQRLADGQVRLEYVETIQGRAGPEGATDIPSRIKLSIPVFAGATPVAVDVALRYRVSEGAVKFTLAMLGRQQAVLDHWAGARNALAQALPNALLVVGQAPNPPEAGK